MKPYKNVRMTQEAWRQYCLLQRRMDWLELSNSREYRLCPGRLYELNARYADVSMGVQKFSELLANGEIKT